jgi:hypothetical protein
MNTLWIVASDTAEYGRVYLPYYAGRDMGSVVHQVLDGARREGFRGSLDDRLKMLGWEIVCVRFEEVPPNAGVKRPGSAGSA